MLDSFISYSCLWRDTCQWMWPQPEIYSAVLVLKRKNLSKSVSTSRCHQHWTLWCFSPIWTRMTELMLCLSLRGDIMVVVRSYSRYYWWRQSLCQHRIFYYRVCACPLSSLIFNRWSLPLQEFLPSRLHQTHLRTLTWNAAFVKFKNISEDYCVCCSVLWSWSFHRECWCHFSFGFS